MLYVYIFMEYMCNASQLHSTLAQDDEEDLLSLHTLTHVNRTQYTDKHSDFYIKKAHSTVNIYMK